MTDQDNLRDRIAELIDPNAWRMHRIPNMPGWSESTEVIEPSREKAQAIIDELRTDEAIERVARGICRRNWPKNDDFVHYWHWYSDDFRADARAAITALLGEH